MNIIVVGCGKVGLTLARQLRREDHAITIIDVDKDRLEAAVGAMDIQGVLGNGTSHRVLVEAGVEQVARGYAKKVSVNVDGMLTASMYRSGDRIVVESRKTEVYIADGETVDDPAEPQNPGK